MNEVHTTETTFEQLSTRHAEGINRVYEYFANKSLDDVMKDMLDPTYVDIDDSRQVQLLEMGGSGPEFDFSRTTVLALPFLNGLAPHQYMRAKALQLLLGPAVPMIVVPNNSYKNEAYTFTDEQRNRLASGNIKPVGEIALSAIERLQKLRFNLGVLQLTGYSQGGLTALAMGAIGSTEVEIAAINADEIPSKLGRSTKKLKSDFLAGGMWDVPSEAKEADIDALTHAMSRPRFALDVMRFGIQSMRRDSKLVQHAMSGTAQALVTEAITGGASIKLGRVAGTPPTPENPQGNGSPMFDIAGIMVGEGELRKVAYTEGFERGHASGDNIIKHALMAADGLTR